jgi:purine-binding chemotaxis protein CheW
MKLLLCQRGPRMYAIQSIFVQEILSVPALLPIAEVPSYVVGVFDLRGELIPVVDIDRRLGQKPQEVRVTDCVVVARTSTGQPVGFLFEHAVALEELEHKKFQDLPDFAPEPGAERCLEGLVTYSEGQKVALLFEPDRMLRLPELPDLPPLPANGHPDPILLKRSREYSHVPNRDERGDSVSLLVLKLGEHSYAVHAVQIVQLFRGEITPLPGCPGHVAGLTSLRGTILPVVDLRVALGSAPGSPAESLALLEKPRVGLLVDQIEEMVVRRETDRKNLPREVPEPTGVIFDGAFQVEDRLLPVLDLTATLEHRRWLVET